MIIIDNIKFKNLLNHLNKSSKNPIKVKELN
jgi:hypothetical protein